MGIKVLMRESARSNMESDEFDPDSGECTIEFYMASKDPFRVAPGREIPVSWPFETSRASNEAIQVVDAIQAEYEKILQENGIKLDRASVHGLCRKDGSNTTETLVLSTMDEDFQAWKVAATEIQEIIDRTLRKQNAGLKITVEVRNQSRMYQDTSSIIRPNTPIEIACEEVQDVVLEQVQKSCPSAWKNILFHMRGPRFQENDRKPTIMVCIARGSRGLWGVVERQIEDAVQQVQCPDVDLHLEVLTA